MALDERDRLCLLEARPALRRNGCGWRFERARHRGPKPTFAGRRVKALVDMGLLRWVNRCRSAAALTEEGELAMIAAAVEDMTARGMAPDAARNAAAVMIAHFHGRWP
jgi:hypothetical protein